MQQNSIIAPVLSYEDINSRAEDFLREHRRNDTLPVDIAEKAIGLGSHAACGASSDKWTLANTSDHSGEKSFALQNP